MEIRVTVPILKNRPGVLLFGPEVERFSEPIEIDQYFSVRFSQSGLENMIIGIRAPPVCRLGVAAAFPLRGRTDCRGRLHRSSLSRPPRLPLGVSRSYPLCLSAGYSPPGRTRNGRSSNSRR